MKIHVPSMLAIGIETINKQTQQTNKHPQWLIKFIKHSHKGLRRYVHVHNIKYICTCI